MESKLSKNVSGIILRYLIRFLEHQTYLIEIAHFLLFSSPPKKGVKNRFLADAFDVVKIDWDVVEYFPARFWKAWSPYFQVPKKYWS